MAVSLLMAASCSDFDDYNKAEADATPSANQTLWENILQNPQLSEFASLLKKSGFDNELNQTQYYTVWAPLNGTFDAASFQSLGNDALMRQFVKNHIASYGHQAKGVVNERILMLNEKTYNFEGSSSYKFDGVDLVQANLPNNNGILHTLNGLASFYPNLYEFVTDSLLSAGMEIDSLRHYFLRYENTYLDTEASVVGPIVDGMQTYIDSVMIERNKLMDRVGRLNAEDSLYYVVIPTEAGWNKAWNTAFECFKYPKTNKDADSLQHFYAYCALMDDAVYSYYQQKAHIESYAYPYPWINPLAYPGRQLYTYSDYPFSPTGIFGSAKERYQCSNGMIFASDEWVFNPTWTYNSYRHVEGEEESSVISYTYCTMTKIDALGDSISARAFTHIKPSGGNSNWNVTYKLTNALSTTYDVYVRVLPKSVTGGENKRPCRFTATINYYDEEGKEQHYTFNNGTPINTNPNIVDVVKVGTFKIPTCNYGQGDGGQPSITLTCSIRANENAKYDRNFYLDDIYLRPVVKE